MTRLAQIRAERGWKKSRLIRELRAAAKCRGIALAQDESIARRIAVWENEGGKVSDLYRELLCRVYQLSPAELGLDDPTPTQMAAQLTERLMVTSVDAELVELLEAQTQSFRLLDRRLGAAHLLSQTEGHVAQIENLLKNALPGPQRTALGAALAEAAALAGWQALDMGNIAAAWAHHETAKLGARESENPTVLAHVAAQQAYALLDADRAQDALEVVQAVHRRAASLIPARLDAWLSAAEGEMHAALEQNRDARRALDRAAACLPESPEDPDLPYIALDHTQLSRWRGNCLARLGADEALTDLTTALEGMNGGAFGRAEASLRVDLALALKARGDVTGAREHAQRAAELAGRTGSARQRRRIAQLLAS